MLKYCYKHVGFYKNSFPGEITSIEKAPIIDKAIMRESAESFLSDEVQKKSLIKEFTSGSTGKPLVLYKTKIEMMKQESYLYKRRQEIVPNIMKITPIKFYAAIITEDTYCRESIHYENRAVYFSMVHLEEESMFEYCKVMQELEAAWIMGPPSIIYKLALYMKNNNISSDNIKYIELTGELVLDWQRESIESIFKCPIRNHYGSREFWCIAYECECGNLHVLDEHVYVEEIDGEFVVSTLDQHTMPILRYRLGDKGHVVYDKCKCGNDAPILECNGGRTSEYIHTKSNRVVSSILIYMLVLHINQVYASCVTQFQVIQKALDEFSVTFVIKQEYSEYQKDIEEMFKTELEQNLEESVICSFEFIDNIENDINTGKYKYFISQLELDKK